MSEFGYDALDAARDAAYWSAASAVAAWLVGGISVALTAGGLIFVWRQLKATELAATAARQASEIAYAAQRAWLKVDVDSGYVSWKDGKWWGEFTATVTNIGRLPALAAHVSWSEKGDHGPPPPGAYGDDVWTIWPQETKTKLVVVMFDKPQDVSTWVICLIAGYRLSGQQQWKQTPTYLQLRRGHRVMGQFGPNHGDVVYKLDVCHWDYQLYSPT